MKKILFVFSLVVMTVLVACNTSNKKEKLIKEQIVTYMNENLKFPSTYEIVELGKIDSLFYSKDGVYWTKINDTYFYNNQNVHYKGEHAIHSFTKKVDSLKFIGFTLTHKYMAKNGMGISSSDEIQFYFPTDLSKVWDKNIHLPHYFDKLPKKWTFTDEEKINIMSLINSKKQEFDNITWYTSKKDNKKGYNNEIILYAGKVNESVVLRMKIYYKASDWLFFEKIQFLYDETPIQIHFERSQKESDVLYGGNIVEWVDIRIESDVLMDKLDALSQSKTVKIKLSGDKYYDERIITQREKDIIQEVINCYKVLDFES